MVVADNVKRKEMVPSSPARKMGRGDPARVGGAGGVFL